MRPLVLAPLLALALAACGSDTTTGSTASSSATGVAETTIVTGGTEASTTVATDSAAASTTPVDSSGVVNVWVGPAADITKLPIGTSKVSTTDAVVGGLLSCDSGNPEGGGAFAVGPWIDEAAGTWDLTTKVSVQGSVSWPMAQYSETVDGASRTISSNGFPVGTVTGSFPIASDDPAFDYDRNPNSIAESDIELVLPVSPSVNATPTCLPKSVIGVFKNGVVAFASLDAMNRDAVAYETQDACDGHPQQSSEYHYHDVPSCLRDATVGASTVVGYAKDGFPIVVERNEAGELPTNADLDECHGRTSPIVLDGDVVTMYHYSATFEFPYFIGCYRGTPVS